MFTLSEKCEADAGEDCQSVFGDAFTGTTSGQEEPIKVMPDY